MPRISWTRNTCSSLTRTEKCIGAKRLTASWWNLSRCIFLSLWRRLDPVETALHSIAYWIQTAREAGNPAEAIFEQGEALWWREDNIVVPYRTDETIDEVAARMISPPAITRNSGEQKDLYEAYLKELADFKAYLDKLNENNPGLGMISIPLPGWSTRRVSVIGGEQIQGDHASGRTFLRSKIAHNNQTTLISRRWNALSAVEQQIEMALTATDGKGYAGFDNIQPFDEAMSWIVRNDGLIHKYAANARVPKQLLQVILAAELLYDYDAKDSVQDIMGRMRTTTNLSWRGAGVGNVHYVTLMDAYAHLEELNEAHVWHIDVDAPDLSVFPKLEHYKLPNNMTQAEFDTNPHYEQEAIRFQQRELEYEHVDFQRVKYPTALYQSTDEGTINSTSIVARMLLDQLRSLDNSLDSDNLSPEDMARIWGRYRTSYEPFYVPDLGPNAQLALPLAEYFLDQD